MTFAVKRDRREKKEETERAFGRFASASFFIVILPS